MDYSDLIAQEAAKGAGANRDLLAQYESQRNAKIDAEGLPYAKTYDYTTRPAGSGWGASDAVGGTGGNGSVSINGSGGVGGSGGSVPSGGYYTARDQSEYINQLYDAAVKSAQAALEGAYNEAVLGFDHAEAQIPEQYRAARNQTSADAAVQRANMNEQLAASGLNTGTSGQARLAMGIAEQNAMAALNRQQQAAIDEITLQRNQARAQYESAVAQAIADNDMQRAQALYQEAQRVDNSYRSYLEDALQQQQYQMNQLSMEATRQQMQLAAAADQREQQLLEAELAGYGSSGGGGGGGGGVSTGTGSGQFQTNDSGQLINPSTQHTTPQAALDVGTQLQQMMAAGASDAEINNFLANAEAQGRINTAQRMQYTRYAGLSGYTGTTATPNNMSSYAQSLLSQLSSIPGLTEGNKTGMVADALNNGRITDTEADYLLHYLGY